MWKDRVEKINNHRIYCTQEKQEERASSLLNDFRRMDRKTMSKEGKGASVT